jgi:hypothetical protein
VCVGLTNAHDVPSFLLCLLSTLLSLSRFRSQLSTLHANFGIAGVCLLHIEVNKKQKVEILGDSETGLNTHSFTSRWSDEFKSVVGNSSAASGISPYQLLLIIFSESISTRALAQHRHLLPAVPRQVNQMLLAFRL